MNPIWKARLAAIASAILAIVIGWWIANGHYALPLIVAAIGVGAGLVTLLRLSVDTIALGGLVVGYIVGNRGFAQISLVPGLPLLPAEVGLALCLGWLLVRVASAKRLALRRDTLNAAVAAWIVVGAVRIYPDTRVYGVVALRDFAMIYYALFFFVAQALATETRARRFLAGCLLVSMVSIVPLFEAFRHFPDFFLGTLRVGGVPLIFYKGDLVATFMAAGVVLTHHRFERTHNRLWLVPALLGIYGVLVSESRASLLALVVATLWLAATGRRNLLWLQLTGMAIAGLILLGGMVTGLVNPRNSAAHRVYERVWSMTDVAGQHTYDNPDVEFKGDNNRFRLVWWRAVAEETMEVNPWLGLGFGHDLAAEFVRRYYPDSTEEFSTRSPHSIIVTALGRTGLVGAGALLAVFAAMAWRTQQAMSAAPDEPADASHWLVAWVILISACFGVVLEGPMGAVVFWTVLGLANGTPQAGDDQEQAGVADDAHSPRVRTASKEPAALSA